MYPSEVDIGVLILFFNRPEPLKQVFEQIRLARPSRLFLYQDGARDERDVSGIEACREVVNQIDWECEVHRNYQTVNAGCDPSNYNAQRWAFSLTDKCVVFEDDSIPSVSFIRFCKEMLDRYEDDQRIVMVSGFNSDEVTPDVPYDYFFTSTFSIWGWASWSRVVNAWDGDYTFLGDDFNMLQLKHLIKERGYRNDIIQMAYDHRALGKAYYESIFWPYMLFNSGLAIVPTRNMVNNLGPVGGSVHYGGSLKTLPRRLRKMFTMQRYELDFPLKHPKYVMEYVDYKEHVYQTNAWNHPMQKIRYSMEELMLNLRYGNFGYIWKSVKARLNKMTGKKKHH